MVETNPPDLGLLRAQLDQLRETNDRLYVDLATATRTVAMQRAEISRIQHAQSAMKCPHCGIGTLIPWKSEPAAQEVPPNAPLRMSVGELLVILTIVGAVICAFIVMLVDYIRRTGATP